jgi:hypothetical protein
MMIKLFDKYSVISTSLNDHYPFPERSRWEKFHFVIIKSPITNEFKPVE